MIIYIYIYNIPYIPLSLALSVCKLWRYKSIQLGSLMWFVDTLGDCLLTIIKLGHSDLLCGFYRAKYTFPMYSNGNKICLLLNGFDNTVQMIVLPKTFIP